MTDIRVDIEVRVQRALDSVNGLISRIGRGLMGAVNSISKAFSGLNGIFSALFGTTAIKHVNNVTTAFIGLNNVLLTFSDDAAEAGTQMQYIIDESLRLGFNVSEVAEAYKKFYAAGRIAGFETKKLQEVFSALSETAAVVGMDSLQLEGAMRALQQMMSKGKVQAEELRGQLGEHLPGAFEIAAQAMGKTTAELDKMLSMGQVTAMELFENFPAALRENYGSQLTAALRTPQRELERLKTDINLIIHEMGPGFEAIGFSVLSAVRTLFSGLGSEISNSINDAMKDAADIISAIPVIVMNAFDIITLYLKPWADLIWNIISWPFKQFSNLMPSSGDPEIMGFWEWLLSTVTNTMTKIGYAVLNLPQNLTTIFNITVRQLSAFIESSVASYEKITESVGLVFEKVSIYVKIAINGMKDFMSPVLNWLVQQLVDINDSIIKTLLAAASLADTGGFGDQATGLRSMASDLNLASAALEDMKINTTELSKETDGYKNRIKEVNSELDGIDEKYDNISNEIEKTALLDISKILEDHNLTLKKRESLAKNILEDAKAEIEYQKQLRSMTEMDKELAADKGREPKKEDNTSAPIAEMTKQLKKYYDVQKSMASEIDQLKNPFDKAYDSTKDIAKLEERLINLNNARKKNKISQQDYNSAVATSISQTTELISLKEDEVIQKLARSYDEVKKYSYEYSETLYDLNVLMEQGSISTHAYNTALYESERALMKVEAQSGKMSKDDQMFKGLNDGLWDFSNNSKTVFEEMSELTTRSFNSMTDELTDFVTTGKMDFKGLVDSIVADLTRIAIQKSITEPLADALSGALGGSGGGILGSVFGSFGGGDLGVGGMGPPTPGVFQADGGVWDKGRLTPFANGGIVNSPTLFPMANGTGLMGESGPEAIMPLTRGADGKLGVSSQGGTQNITININVSGTEGNPEAIRRSAGQVAQAAGNATQRAMRRNG